MSAIEAIRGLTEPLLAARGLELWDVEVDRGTVRILVDRAGGVDLDGLASTSRAVSKLLDDHPEAAPGRSYQLEVSSPGVERTLRTPEQYRRYLGTPVAARTTEPVGGQRRWRGTLAAVDDTGVVIVPEDPSTGDGQEEPVRLRYDQIDRARTVLDWGAPAAHRSSKAGGGPARRPDSRGKAGARRAASPGAELKEIS